MKITNNEKGQGVSSELSINKAAHLLGVPRRQLQRQIREGVLQSEDGRVRLDELQRVYPSLTLEDSGVLEELELIKQSAFSRRISQRVMPDQDEIEQQLKKRTKELGVQKARAEKYRGMLMDLLQQIERWREDEDQCKRVALDDVCEYINQRLRQG